jgi:Ala-tRNA(Pro) deacylase
MNVQDFLRNRDIPFDALEHDPTYTAQSLAQAVHVSGEEVAKTVLLAVDDGFVLAVLPATHQVDTMRVKAFLGATRVELATERECGRWFEDCELGVLPPFGSKYGLRTMVDRSLLEDEMIVFEGNSHHEAIRMSCQDFIDVEEPIVASFSHHI